MIQVYIVFLILVVMIWSYSIDFPTEHKFHMLKANNIGVPFYLLSNKDHPHFDVFHVHCGKPIFAKGVEVMWLEQLKQHPWRVHHPNDALIFVIPGLFSVAIASELGQADKKCTLALEEMEKRLAYALLSFKHYQESNGANFLMVVSYFKAQKFIYTSKVWNPIIQNITLGTTIRFGRYLKLPKNKCHPVVGHLTKVGMVNHIIPPILNVNRTIFFMGQAVHTGYYDLRREIIKTLGSVGTNSFVVASDCLFHDKTVTDSKLALALCLTGQQSNCCLRENLSYNNYLIQLATSNYSLNIKGGDAGSARTFDAILLNIPQIVFSEDFYRAYAPFHCSIPWHEIAAFVNVKEFKHANNPAKYMENFISKLDRKDLQRKQSEYRLDLLWNHPKSRSASNLLVEVAKDCLGHVQPNRGERDDPGSKYAKLAAIRNLQCINVVPHNQNV